MLGEGMKIRFKKLHPEATMPVRKTEHAAGYDVTTIGRIFLGPQETTILPTGLAVEIPEGYHIKVSARSSMAARGLITLHGIIDSDYRGEVGVVITNASQETIPIKEGERIGQFILEKNIDVEFEESEELNDTDRGAGGFGSTGK
jgi:dUTP pyrophosphatase